LYTSLLWGESALDSKQPGEAAGTPLHAGKLPGRGAARKPYKQSVVYEYLRPSIITGIYPPEKPLIERDICDRLGVSRTPVREAFRRLSSEGLVEFLPGRGVVAASLTKEKAEHLHELKEALECMAAKLCVLRMTDNDFSRMEECLRQHREAVLRREMEVAADLDLRFHVILVEGARSPMLEQQAKSILWQTRRLSQLSVCDSENSAEFIAQHAAILEALKRRDAQEAAAAVSRHIESVKEFQWERWNLLF
jgi:DNA-binding GntR family transcriptional regulator